MAEQKLSIEEQKILALIQKVKTSSEGPNKKVILALKNSQKFLDEAIKLLEGTESNKTIDDKSPDAPYGRKENGTPKKAPGRAAAVKPVIKDKIPTENEPSV